ncbi:hypothetical protein ACFY4C_37105 [Actinomadura viridis]|uniref:hypothetical protein n=1 Tax=Actinomadura viridis TaxID=58110 RepID=UPI0036AA691C
MSAIRGSIEEAWRARLDRMRERALWLETVTPAGQDDQGMAVMEALLGVYAGLAQWGSAAPAEAERLRARVRRPELAEILRGERAQGALSAYAEDGQRYALRGRTDGYRGACEHRSAVQLLADDFAEYGVIVDPFVQEAIDGFDGELRDVAENGTPVHRGQIPSWAPRSHWWWWAPRTDMSMREYRERLYSGDLEPYESSAPGAADWLRCGDDKECWCFTAPA